MKKQSHRQKTPRKNKQEGFEIKHKKIPLLMQEVVNVNYD